MIQTWIMIIMIGSYGHTVTIPNYDSRDSCLAAKEEMVAQGGDRRLIICIPAPKVAK